MENLSKVIPMCDKVEVYDNTHQFKSVALFIAGKEIGINKSCNWLKHLEEPFHLSEQ